MINEILNEQHKLLAGKKTDIVNKSEKWIKKIEKECTGIEKNLLLATVYYMKSICTLDFADAEISCSYYDNIPFDFLNEANIKAYVHVLKLCYKFDIAVSLLTKVLNYSPWFELKYFCLSQLSDDAMVADGVITKEEFLKYIKECLELLTKEKTYFCV